MSMLAGPRRKQKVINLRAKNSVWSNDTNKFGQRMLEKMGWTSGKGLGAQENGIVEHVVAKYKNDEKGLGYEDKNDQWTKHEDDFNALLANLSSADSNEATLPSGVSLEVKSKKSKARIHYHKFTRGKDLSRYSEKDLANIFGKKSLRNVDKPEEAPKDDIKTTEQVFTEKGSMDDYFKNKMATFKLNNKFEDSKDQSNDGDADCGFQGFSSANDDEEKFKMKNVGFGFQPFSFYSTNVEAETENFKVNCDNAVKKIKKKKKSKAKKLSECKETLDSTEVNGDSEKKILEAPVPEKKSKKKRHLGEKIIYENEPQIKKPKKAQVEDFSNISVDHEEEHIHVRKIKKKKKDKSL